MIAVHKKFLLYGLAFCVLLLTPQSFAHAQTPEQLIDQITKEVLERNLNPDTPTNAADDILRGFQKDGVYGCGGGRYGAIGLIKAPGIVVPVSEQAVALNTNIAIYKECVLDGIVIGMRESLSAFMAKSIISAVTDSQSFPPVLGEYYQSVRDKVFQETIQGERTENICAPFKQDVRIALLTSYAQERNAPHEQYSCTLPEEELKGFSGFSSFYEKIVNPGNTSFGAFVRARNLLRSQQNAEVGLQQEELSHGQGFLPFKKCEDVSIGGGATTERCETVTPGSVVNQVLNRVIQTGQDQVEQADEIDELVGSLLANLHTQIITSSGGLSGLTTPAGGGPSFLDRVTKAATERAQSNFSGAGLNLLNDTISVETDYRNAKVSASNVMTNTESALRGAENTCWSGILARAQSDLLAEVVGLACASFTATSTCPYTGSVSVQTTNNVNIITATAEGRTKVVVIATDTVHSDQIIASNIAPLKDILLGQVDSSGKIIALLTRLRADLSGVSSASAARFVLERIDALVASRSLHTVNDVTTANSQRDNITNAMQSLLEDVSVNWNGGWCAPSNWQNYVRTSGDSINPGRPTLTKETDTGVSSTDTITATTTPTLSGACVQGDTVTLYVGNTVRAQNHCPSTTYKITPSTPLTQGVYALSVQFTDPFNRPSPRSPELSIVIDTTPPVSPVVLAPTPDGSTTDVTPTLRGTAEVASTITVAGPGARSCTAVTAADNSWSCTITDAFTLAGDKVFAVTATDIAGNVSTSTPTNFTVVIN